MKRRAIPYSAAEMAWLESNRTMIISDYHRAFVAQFGRDDVTAAHLHGLRKRRGWKVGRAPGRFTGRRLKYSDTEIAWLSAHRALPIGEYHRAFVEQFGRDDVSPAKLHALRKREGFSTGRTGRFEKGRTPENKGKKCTPGTGGRHPNAQKTQYKKGNLTGLANRNYKPIGTERISKDGYRERKVHDGLPLQSRWQAVHRIEWEAAHGPIPKDMALKCIDGNKLDTKPSNWKLVPRAILPRLAGGRAKRYLAYDSAPAALKPALLAVAELEHGVREQRRGRT